MSKKDKKKKGSQQQGQGGYKRFLNDLQQALHIIDYERKISEMSNEFKHMMYDYKHKINNPEAGNEYVSNKELKLISEKAYSYYHQSSLEFDNRSLSSYQLQLLFCYTSIKEKETEKQMGVKDHPDVLADKEAADLLLTTFYTKYVTDYFRIITQLCRPDQKYYGINIRAAAILNTNPKMELINEIYGFPACKYMMTINGFKRPAYRLGKPFYCTIFEWISLDASLVGNLYKGNQKKLEVYIQSHALQRLKERLDLLDQEAINYSVWENTSAIKGFETYRGYLLLPFKVFGTKIGYLAAKINEEKILFSTFLFITHNCTPEGDRLKRQTGLGKEDISYWHIDRLSTFVKLKEEKYPGLIQLFGKVGMGNLMELKNKKFNIDSMQAANLDGLAEYISRGRQEGR